MNSERKSVIRKALSENANALRINFFLPNLPNLLNEKFIIKVKITYSGHIQIVTIRV